MKPDPFTFDEYRMTAAKTERHNLTDNERLAMLALGLAGEAGELIDTIKKKLFHDHPLDKENMEKEIGDTLWYLDRLSAAIGSSLATCARNNNLKLTMRYPGGFSSAASRARVDTSGSTGVNAEAAHVSGQSMDSVSEEGGAV